MERIFYPCCWCFLEKDSPLENQQFLCPWNLKRISFHDLFSQDRKRTWNIFSAVQIQTKTTFPVKGKRKEKWTKEKPSFFFFSKPRMLVIGVKQWGKIWLPKYIWETFSFLPKKNFCYPSFNKVTACLLFFSVSSGKQCSRFWAKAWEALYLSFFFEKVKIFLVTGLHVSSCFFPFLFYVEETIKGYY